MLSARYLSLLFLVGVGCSRSGSRDTAKDRHSAPVSVIDACALISKEEISAIQGGEVKEVKPSRMNQGGLVTSQCYFTLPSAADSINLAVIQQSEGSDARNPRDEWDRSFHPKEGTHEEGDKEEEGGKGSQTPEKIDGLGEEAFWLDSRFGGVLYALKGNTYLRISVGGPGDRVAKKKNCAAIAKIALDKL